MENQPEFSEIYEQYYPQIVRYLSRMVGEHSAEDVAQVVFEKVNRGLADFQGRSKLSTWIYRIATNAALDNLKSMAAKPSFSGPLSGFPIQQADMENTRSTVLQAAVKSPDQHVVKDEMNECIREFVDRLAPDYRTIIILSELKDFSNNEIAEILDISLDAAKIRLHRARAKLKKEFESGCDFYHDEHGELACDRKQS